jgi:hypothetical protein
MPNRHRLVCLPIKLSTCPMKYLIALTLALLLGFAQSSNAQCIDIYPDPNQGGVEQCDQVLCGPGAGEECDQCKRFIIDIPAGCSFQDVLIIPPGTFPDTSPCFSICTDLDVRPWNECTKEPKKLQVPGGGTIVGPAILTFTLCTPLGGAFTAQLPSQCAVGCPATYPIVVP